APSGPPSRSTRRLGLLPFLARSVGLGPTFFPPAPSLAQPRVGALPVEVDVAQFGPLGDHDRPDPLHHAVGAPALEPPLPAAGAAGVPGAVLPPAPGAEAVDDAVEVGAPVRGRASCAGAGVSVLLEHRQDAG